MTAGPGGPGAEAPRPVPKETGKVEVTAPDKKPARVPHKGFLHFLDRQKERSPLPDRASWNDVLIRAKHERNHAIPDNVQEIDLNPDSLSQDMDGMAARVIDDPTHREIGKLIRMRQRLFGPTKITREPEARHGRGTTFTKNLSDTYEADNKRDGKPVVSLHIHPVDIPPSPSDIEPLLLSPEHPAAELAVMIGTVQEKTISGRKILIFRGSNAVSLSKDQADDLESEWRHEVLRRSHETYNSAATTEQESERLDRIIQEQILSRRAQELGLKVFIAQPGENIARLQKPQQPQGIPTKNQV